MEKISIAQLMREFKPQDKIFISNTDGKRTNEPREVFKIDTTSIITKRGNGKKVWLRKPTSETQIFKDENGSIILKNYLFEENNDLIISRVELMFKHQILSEKILIDFEGYEYKIKDGKKVLLNKEVIQIW